MGLGLKLLALSMQALVLLSQLTYLSIQLLLSKLAFSLHFLHHAFIPLGHLLLLCRVALLAAGQHFRIGERYILNVFEGPIIVLDCIECLVVGLFVLSLEGLY